MWTEHGKLALRVTIGLVAVVLLVVSPSYAQTPVGTAFTYQGQLKQAGVPVDNTADFEFTLWDDPNSTDPGNLVAGPLAADNVDVEGGLFTVVLDFGSGIFTGDARWLEIAVRSPAGVGSFTTLSPRQEVTPVPYTLMAANTVGVDGPSLDAADGSPVNAVYVGDDGRIRLGGTGGAGPKTVNIHGGMDVFDDDGIGNSEGIRFTSNSYEFAELVGETPIWDYYQATDTHRFYTGDQTLRMTITSDGSVGISTPSPSYPLHVENASPDGIAIFGLADNGEQNSTGIGVYGRSDSEEGTGVYGEATHTIGSAYGVRGVSAHGTGVQGEHQDTGNFGALGRWLEGVYGESTYGVSGIGVHGKWTGAYPGYGFGGAFTTTSHLAAGVLGRNEATEPGGSGVIGVHEHTTGAGYGVRGETASSDGHGVHGHASATSGANRGVYGQTDSYDGHAGYFENTASGNYGALGGDDYGVQGRGDNAGGFFEDAGGSTYAYVGHSDLGIKAFGAGGGGYFEDISASGYAYVGYGDYGIEAKGSGAGGYFEDTNSTGRAYVAQTNSGIEAFGSSVGGYFQDSDGSGDARVGYGDRGIDAAGSEAGGYFQDTDDSGYAYVGCGDHGIEAFGSHAGGYFEDTNDSGFAYVAGVNKGIEAYGGTAGGYFQDTDDSGYAFIGYGDHGIEAAGSDAGAVFADTDGSGCAYLGYGDLGISGRGDLAGGYFEDTDGSGYAYVGRGNTGIEASGTLAGGYFEDPGGSGYAYVGQSNTGINAYGTAAGGFFQDTSSGNYAYVGYATYKIHGAGAAGFVQNHPEEPDKVIVYACPEGDEVATYTRGTARLVNGEAIVPLGDTFKWVTNPDIGLTAHLTPHDYAVPLAVASLTTEELVVRGPRNGPGEVVFDYIVYGLRIGFEEVGIVQEKEREAYIPSMADHRALYERRPELRDYNALERFKRTRADIGQTEPLDLSASQALHDAIAEFDPEIHGIEHSYAPRTEDIPGAHGDAETSAAPSSRVGPADIPGPPAHGRPPEIINHKDAEIDALQAECAARQQRIEALEDRLTRLEALLSTPSGR